MPQSALLSWCRLARPFENADDILMAIAQHDFKMDVNVTTHTWPSSKSLAATATAAIPAESNDYVNKLEDIKTKMNTSLTTAINAFKGKTSTKLHSLGLLDNFIPIRKLAMRPPAPRPQVIIFIDNVTS